MSKKITRSKTFWVNMLIMVAAAVTAVSGTTVVADYPTVVAVLVTVSSALNIMLRMVTKVPIG